MNSRSSRRAAVTVALLLLSVAAVAALRGRRKPYTPEAPAYRQAGPADAPVVIAEFSDFQCPGCGMVSGSVEQLRTMHPGRLRIVFKHHPWSFHPHALEAAIAAECAGAQERFWPMHDQLFAHQITWSQSARAPQLFAQYARELKLDMGRFESCRKDPGTTALIERDLNEADQRWINSTPTFFLNGRRLVGPRQWLGQGVREVERLMEEKR